MARGQNDRCQDDKADKDGKQRAVRDYRQPCPKRFPLCKRLPLPLPPFLPLPLLAGTAFLLLTLAPRNLRRYVADKGQLLKQPSHPLKFVGCLCLVKRPASGGVRLLRELFRPATALGQLLRRVPEITGAFQFPGGKRELFQGEGVFQPVHTRLIMRQLLYAPGQCLAQRRERVRVAVMRNAAQQLRRPTVWCGVRRQGFATPGGPLKRSRVRMPG